MASGLSDDPHSESGFACPRNYFSIKVYAELQPFEALLAAKRGGELEDGDVTGKFDVQHLRSVHKFLFQDVFPWAGELRVVNLSKGNCSFAPAMHIHGALTDALGTLKAEGLLVGLTAPEFTERAAFYLGELNTIHPFREGNGRAQREFIRQLALQAGHPVTWAGFTQQEMLDASIASHLHGDNAPLAAILHRALYSTRHHAEGA